MLALRAAGGPLRASLPGAVEVRGVGVPGLAGTHRRNLGWLIGVLAELWRQRRGNFHIVHVHASGVFEPLLAALAARLVVRAPLVLTLHHSAQATYRAQSRRDAAVQILTRASERAALKRAARVLTLTERAASRLAGQGHLQAQPDCLDVAAFSAAGADAVAAREFRERLGVPADARVVLYAGRLSREKGWPVLLELVDAVQDVHVVVCGDGPDRDALAAAAGPRLHLAGAVAPDVVATAMAAADVLVLPSALEELGSVLLEAMAVGLVSVAYDTGGVAEAVVPEVTGLLVPAGDVGALIDAVARALSDEALRARARTEGPRHARERFDTSTAGARLRDLYLELADGEDASITAAKSST